MSAQKIVFLNQRRFTVIFDDDGQPVRIKERRLYRDRYYTQNVWAATWTRDGERNRSGRDCLTQRIIWAAEEKQT